MIMKTEFELQCASKGVGMEFGGTIEIIGTKPKYIPYIAIDGPNVRHRLYFKDKDLERFAVNILKALKSDKLK